MVSLKQKRQSGFTIVELLIVIIIIGILAGLVVTQILGANAKARDTERKTDITNMAQQLETYFAKTGGLPNVNDLNDSAWRKANEVNGGDNDNSLADPSSPSTKTLTNGKATANTYGYEPAPTGCASPTNSAGTSVSPTTPCKTFTLSATLENTKDSQLDTASGYTTMYVKRSANQ